MWIGRPGGPADDAPTPEQVRRWQQHISPPENELPAGVGLSVLLAHGDDAAAGITQIEAFSTGFRFTLAVRLRRIPPELRDGRLFMLIGSHAAPDTELERRLLLGIEYADGRRASTLTGMPMPVPGPGRSIDSERLVLMQNGGGGGRFGVDQTYWVSPLPPEGPVTFVLAWPGFGLPESQTVVDSGPIRAAAERGVTLWPADAIIEPETPPQPGPTSGWFAQPPS